MPSKPINNKKKPGKPDLLAMGASTRKAYHDYKKIKRDEYKKTQSDPTKKVDEQSKAIKKRPFGPRKYHNMFKSAEKIAEEKKKAAEDKEKKYQKNIQLRDQKRRERDTLHKNLKAKTSKGQPVMSHQISYLLDKITKNQSVYCPKK